MDHAGSMGFIQVQEEVVTGLRKGVNYMTSIYKAHSGSKVMNRTEGKWKQGSQFKGLCSNRGK